MNTKYAAKRPWAIFRWRTGASRSEVIPMNPRVERDWRFPSHHGEITN
jgi:hypothetical protein